MNELFLIMSLFLQITDQAEIDAHPLEVRYARLKIRQFKDKENASIGGNVGGGAGAAAGGASMIGAFGMSGGESAKLCFIDVH